MEKLPLNRIKPKKSESLYSFLHRLALENHYEHLGSMFTELKSAAFNENCNDIHPSQSWYDFISILLERLGLNINALVTNQYDHLFIRRNKEMNRKNIRKFYHRYSTKYCPECMQEDFYHRIYWDLSYVTVCLKHNTSLITHCSNCNDVVKLSRLVKGKCKCGQKYTKVNSVKPNSVTLEVQKKFQPILFGEKQEIKRKDGSFINREEYLDFLYLFRHVIKNLDINVFSLSNHYKIEGKLIFGEKNIRFINLNKLNFIVSTLHFLITNPIRDLGSLITSLDNKRKGRNYSVNSRHNKYHNLKEIFDFQMGEFYHLVYSDILINKKDEYINERFMVPPLKKDKIYLSVTEALPLVNTTYKTLKNLCEYKLIKQHITYNDGKKVMLFEKASIDEYHKMKNTSFTLNQATMYLGLNYQYIKELLDLKIIQAKHGPGVDGYALWYISKDEIYRFENELKGKFLPLSSVNSNEGLTIQQVCNILRRERIRVGDVYQLILYGRLRVFHDGNARLIDGIRVHNEDVKRLVKELYYKRISEKG
ncbi:TniQ family protein [Neobacillus novalis]|uniref:TniQ family protein n=1 Tax=Neobacillus novalis TaxID=220687 RepID=A0AA95MIZ2_9BACI|nr:TniQ family protein [Neobacillus novalis]WHY84682.1 TniQ family protein [Neobacillus novalis]